MAAILNSAILNLAILESAILVFPLKLTHTWQDWFPPFEKKNFTHSFWLNLMKAAILNSAILDLDAAILDSDTLLSSLRFTQKQSHSTLTLTQTNSIWLTAILNSAMLDSDTLFSSLRFTQKHSNSILTLTQTNSIWLKLIHSHSTWWWQPPWILPSWIWPSWIQPS